MIRPDPILVLVDDGTLDVVFRCTLCGGVERCSPEWIQREHDGGISPLAIEELSVLHDCSDFEA